MRRSSRAKVRRRRWPRILLLLLGVPAALAAAALAPLADGRTRPPAEHVEAVRLGLRTARQAGAVQWAPQTLRQSEYFLRAGQVEYLVQETRSFLTRDFASASECLRLAESTARMAAVEATQRREAARAAATESIERAEGRVADADLVARVSLLLRTERIHLQRARLLLHEAKLLYADGIFLSSRERAEESLQELGPALKRSLALAGRFIDSGQIHRWRQWVEATIADSRARGGPAIIVYKEKNILHLYSGGRLVRSYPADMGSNTLDTKHRSGDSATPEGRYRIVSKKGRGQSRYHMALLLNYPNDEDRRRFEEARRQGRIPRGASAGSLIEIHGDGGRGRNWTFGCVALTNPDMEQLFRRVEVGTPVTIVGGDGRDGVFSRMVRELDLRGIEEGS